MSSRLLLMHNKKTRRIASFFIALECKMLVEDLLRFLIIVTNYQDCIITRSQNQSIFGVFIIVVNRIKFKLGNAVLLSFLQCSFDILYFSLFGFYYQDIKGLHINHRHFAHIRIYIFRIHHIKIL